VTTDHVLVETWFLLGHRLGPAAAERFWEALRAGAALVEPVGAADLEVAFSIGLDFPDQDFSIVDRTGFAVMRGLVCSARRRSTSATRPSASAGSGTAPSRSSAESERPAGVGARGTPAPVRAGGVWPDYARAPSGTNHDCCCPVTAAIRS
jgi:hypothetical protein